jgi:EAL domain-containing protein (putative c-di-GMP-specific phosphodiesterase class I)
MRTLVIERKGVDSPYLERCIPGATPERTPLESFPFSVGRTAASSLQVADGRVSREHAVLTRDGDRYFIRDLGSTNGTTVNGQAIQEAELKDGDLITFADIEFTFGAGGEEAERQATQVIGHHGAETNELKSDDVINALRRQNEMLAHRAVEVLFAPIVDLGDGSIVALDATWGIAHPALYRPNVEQAIFSGSGRVAVRLRQLQRMVAAEQIGALAQGARVFLPVDTSEIGGESLALRLARLAKQFENGSQLVVTLPAESVADEPYFRNFSSQVRDLNIGLAYDGFVGGKTRLADYAEVLPDYLRLAPTVGRSLARDAECRDQLAELVEAASKLDCAVIVSALDDEAAADAARSAGCPLGQGEHCGKPRPLHEFSQIGPSPADNEPRESPATD